MDKFKIYKSFFDIHGNEYNFENYLDFSKFWFNIPRKHQIKLFPKFKDLQNYAANSKEARTKLKV